MKKTMTVILAAVCAGSMVASAAIVGFESWGGTDDTWEPTLTSGGLTGIAVGTYETGGTWFNHNNSDWNYGASNDGTFGTLASPAASTAVALGEGISLANGYDGYIDFTVTNGTAAALDMQGFHFDAGASRTGAAKSWDLSVLAGSGITVGAVDSGGPVTVATAPITDDYDVDLTVLADSSLGAGEWAIFRLNWTGGQAPEISRSGHNLMLDNVAITAIPEPATLGLIAASAGGLLFIRRRFML